MLFLRNTLYKHYSLLSPSLTFVFLFVFVVKRGPKNILVIRVMYSIMQTRSWLFYYLIHVNITSHLPVFHSGQCISAARLFDFLLVFQNWNDKISIHFFGEMFFEGFTLYWLQHPSVFVLFFSSSFFSMKISSLHWNGAAHTCKEWVLWKETGDYQIS